MRQGDSQQVATGGQAQQPATGAERGGRAPGKTTLTSRLASRGRPVQRMAAGVAEEVPGPDLGAAAGQPGGPDGGGGGATGGGPEPRQVQVREGDTLWGLAEGHLGSGERWPEIYELNRGVVGNDPNLILPEQTLAVPPSEAEIAGHLEQVKAQAGAGNGEGEEGAEGEDGAVEEETAEGADAEGQPPGAGEADAPGAGAGGGAGAGAAGAGAGGATGAVPGPGADGSLPFWAEVAQSFPWDEEVAQHDTFRSAAAECAGGSGGGGAAGGVPNTGALVADALLQGAGAGLVLGGVSLGIDTAINMGSSRIPMLAGFVEVGQMVYGLATDPAGWASGKLDGLLGNKDGVNMYAEGWRKLTSGDPLDMLEGAVDLFDGLKSTIDTLSSICWIVAGLGFILSWIPGMQWLIPFVALAAKWGTVLGAVATVMGAVLSILRGVLIAFRSIDLLTGESDPEVARQKALRLRQDTQAFTQSWTERAGNSAREGIAGSPHRRDTPDPPPSNNGAPAERPSGLRRALGFATSTAFGTGQFSTRAGNPDTGEKPGALRQLGTDLAAVSTGTVHAANLRQTTGERIDALESRGVDVYINQRHRDHVNRRLGENRAEPGSEQGALGQSRRRVADAEQRQAQARRTREQADADLRQARQDLDAAHQRLQDARAQNAPARQHQEQQVAEAKALMDSYDADVRAIETEMATAQTTLEMARAARQAHPDDTTENGAFFRAKLEQAEADMARLQRDMDLARSGYQEAQELHREERAELDRVMQVERDALADVDRAAVARDAASGRQEQASQGEADAAGAESRAREDLRDMEEYTKPARDNFDERMQNLSAYVWWRDVSGKGADDGNLYGHNKGSGVTGSATGHIMNEIGEPIAGEVHTSMPQFSGLARTASGEPGGEEQGPAGQEGGVEAAPGPDYQAQICEQIAALAGSLPPPPLEVPGQVDGAAKGMAELLAEEELLEAQRVRSTEARGVAEQSLVEIDGTKGLVAGGQAAASSVQAETEVLLERQTTLQTEAGNATAEAGNAAGQAGEGHGLIGGFVGKFVELMGRIPSRFVSNAGEGTGGAQELQDAGNTGPEVTAMAQESANTAATKAGAWQGETRAVQGEVQGSTSELDNLSGAVGQREDQTRQGLTDLDQADADIEAALAEIAAEKARLTSEHGAAVSTGQAWTEQHRGARLAGQAELDALVAEAEAAQNAAGAGPG